MAHTGDATFIGYSHKRDHRAIMPVRRRNVVGGFRDEGGTAGGEALWVGDETNWLHWPAHIGEDAPDERSSGVPGHTRSISGWSLAWPSTKPDADHALPLWALFTPDSRFTPLADVTGKGTLPGGRTDETQIRAVDGQPYPGGTTGVLLAGTRERNQENLFFPAPTPLVAHHLADRPPHFSTLLHDIAGDTLDPDHEAGLHSTHWVRHTPAEPEHGPWVGDPAIAWTMKRSGGDVTGYGLVYGLGDGDTYRAIGRVVEGVDPNTGYDTRRITWDVEQTGSGAAQATLATAAHPEVFGPLHVGHARADKHRHGFNDEDEALNSLHLATGAYWYMDQERDAPLAFTTTPYPKVGAFDQPTAVTLSYDPQPTHPWFVPRPGLWKWWTTTPIIEPTPPSTPPDPPTPDPPFSPPAITPEGTPRSPLPEPNPTGEHDYENDSQWAPARVRFELAYPSWMPVAVRWPGRHPYDSRYGWPRALQQRLDAATRAGEHAAGATAETWRRASSLFAPMTGHFQGFAAIRADGTWDYTVEPDSPASRRTGTANGGLWFTEPERHLDGTDPSTVSTTSLALAPAVKLAWGTPQIDGTVADGPVFSTTGSGGSHDLTLGFLDANGVQRGAADSPTLELLGQLDLVNPDDGATVTGTLGTDSSFGGFLELKNFSGTDRFHVNRDGAGEAFFDGDVAMDAGLTVGDDITVGNAALGDGVLLLKLLMARSWQFESRGIGASQRLALRALVNGKSFEVCSADGSLCAVFRTNDTDAYQELYVDGVINGDLGYEVASTTVIDSARGGTFSAITGTGARFAEWDATIDDDITLTASSAQAQLIDLDGAAADKTVNLPSSPSDGLTFELVRKDDDSTRICTISAAGGAQVQLIKSAPAGSTTLATRDAIALRYHASDAVWYQLHG